MGIHNRNGKAPTYINMKVVEKQKNTGSRCPEGGKRLPVHTEKREILVLPGSDERIGTPGDGGGLRRNRRRQTEKKKGLQD